MSDIYIAVNRQGVAVDGPAFADPDPAKVQAHIDALVKADEDQARAKEQATSYMTDALSAKAEKYHEAILASAASGGDIPVGYTYYTKDEIRERRVAEFRKHPSGQDNFAIVKVPTGG